MTDTPTPSETWQDISTEGETRVMRLVYGVAAGEINGIYPAPQISIAAYVGPGGDYPGFDWMCQDGDAYAVWFKPTHWHPLPTPPSSLKG